MSDAVVQRTPSTKQKGCDLLVREDFDAGPTNLDCIEPGLWLGNLTAATTETVLTSHKINHILTIDSCPLPRNITLIYGMKTKFIQVTDHPREDLLTFLEDTFEFIKQGIENGAVLVHCYFGVSRSAAIVIAFMMKKYQLSFNKALGRVKEKRRFVGPNPGFESQLKIYELMGWKIDKNNLQYRMFRLQVASDNVKKVKILPQNCLDVVKPDPSLITVRPDPRVYRCRKCRRIVASASNIVPHVPKEKSNWMHAKWTTDKDSLTLCSETFFIEPLAWMPAIHQNTDGKIHCPKCRSKLGSFSWTMGCQCPCGAKVSPAFYLVPSKVEWSNRVQNVQVTL